MCKKWVTIMSILALASTGCKNSDDPNGLLKNGCDTSTCFVEGNNWKMAVSTDGTFGYDPADLDQNSDNSGGIYPHNNVTGSIYAAGIFVGATKEGVPSVTMAQFLSEFSQGRIVNTVPVGIAGLVYSDSGLDKVHIIDQDRSGYSWDHWPVWAGAPESDGEPEVLSAEDSWVVFHDADSSKHPADASGGDVNPILGIEVRQSTYSFTGTTLEDVFLVRWRITNKSDINYTDLYVGLWCDADLGDASNDVVGSDTLNQMVFQYNRTNEGTNNLSIGLMPMYVSGIGLHVMPSAMIQYLKSGDEARPDNEQFNLMKGLNGNGTVRTDVVPNHPTYDFPGDPVLNTGIVDTVSFDKRIFTTVGPIILNSGQTKDFVYAVIGSQGSDRLDAVVKLRNTAAALEDIFATQIATQLGY